MGAEAQQGIMMRAALVAMLVLPAAVAYSSGSSYASGSTSAYASAASAYASASKAAPAPSPPNTVTIQVVKATITLPGVTAASFNANTEAGKKVRLAFQASIASGLKICGTKGSDQCTSSDVVITDVSRRRSGAKVEFYVKTASATAAKSGATALNTILTKNGGADFVTTLKAEAKKAGATELEKVTGVTVTKAPAAGTQTITKPAASSKTAVAAASVTAGVSLASLAFAALVLQ